MDIESSTLSLANGDAVECGQTLRSLPAKRHVCAGRFDGRPVIVKVFLDRRRARVHFRRELDGLHAFHNVGIAAPEVLYAGDDAAGRPVIVLAHIGNAVALSTLWENSGPEPRAKLMRRMIDLLARHHAAGICQTDLHLDNFLVADGLVYSLDGDGVLAQGRALDERRSLQNLALYFSQLDPGQDAQSLAMSAHYAHRRVWPEALVRERVAPMIEAARAYRWRKFQSKIYRDCTAVEHLRTRDRDCYLVRDHHPGLRGLLDGLDASCPHDPAVRLKDGNTATVWSVSSGDHELVVKRYNIKGRWHGLMRTLKESRASISWRNAHMLEMFGVATPDPVAFCIRREALLRPVAYFLAERIDGISLVDWVAQHQHEPAQLARVARQAGELLAQLERLQISHGDMKAANFILSEERLFVIDLDAMRRHRFPLMFKRAWRRDMKRFYANWREQPRVLGAMQREIEAVLKRSPGTR